MPSDALRAHEIVFGPWKAEFCSWFAKLAGSGSIPVDPGVASQLAEALFDAQKYVLQKCVEVDLQLFEPSAALYRDLSGSAEKLAQLFEILDDSDKLQAFRADAVPVTRTHAQAYEYYCAQILNPPSIDQDWWTELWRRFLARPSLGLNAFVKRQPQAKTLLDRVAKNFRDNVEECLKRVRGDRKAIETCFLDGGTIVKITRIDSPGSDPHKGGKRVVILTFEYRPGQEGTAQKRVVYKPSDVEIDYRLAGRNTPALQGFLEACEHSRDAASYPAPPYQSLYEFVDGVVLNSLNETVAEVAARNRGEPDSQAFIAERARVLEMLALPSYVILPRNPGSRLPSIDSPPIRNSYGYLEYLTHDPAPLPPFGTPLDRYVLGRVRDEGKVDPQWDWITDRGDEARSCFRLWGRLMVIACLFLQTDLHWDNQRVRRRKPHLIDLENCLVKKAEALGDTLFFCSGTGPETQVWQVQTFENPAQPRELAGMSLEVMKGIVECLRAMRSKRNDLATWIQRAGIGKCIVRHVVRKTEDFNRDIRRLVDTLLGEQTKAANERRDQATLFAEFMDRQAQIATRDWEAQNRPADNRCFLLETADRNGVDYQNLDVPAWYRRVDSKAILSSEGKPVADYYETTGLQLLKDSLDGKLVEDAKEAQKVLVRFIAFLQRDLPAIVSKGRK
jgi:hypothetical protein